jgi:hypothetical protein
MLGVELKRRHKNSIVWGWLGLAASKRLAVRRRQYMLNRTVSKTSDSSKHQSPLVKNLFINDMLNIQDVSKLGCAVPSGRFGLERRERSLDLIL